MAWTANIVEKSFDTGLLKFNVVFSNGSEKFNEEYRVSEGVEMQATIDRRLIQLQSVDDALNGVLPVKPPAPTPTPPTPPSQFYDVDLPAYQRLKYYADVDIIAPDHPELLAALDAAKKSFPTR